MQVVIDKFIWKVSDNANAIRFLAFTLGRIIWNNMEINFSKYQQLVADLDHLMDGLDTLIFRFAFTYYDSIRQTARTIRPCENEVDRTF